jgi:hypothetical protein
MEASFLFLRTGYDNGPYPISSQATQVDTSSLQCIVRHVGGGGMRGHVMSTTHATCVVAGTTTVNSTALAPMGQCPRHSGVACMACVSLNIFGHQIMSSNMMAKPILAFAWRTIASCAGQAGQMMTSSSSSSFPFSWLTPLGPGSITCPETRSIAGRISRRSSLTTFRARTCGSTTPRI